MMTFLLFLSYKKSTVVAPALMSRSARVFRHDMHHGIFQKYHSITIW